MDSMRRRLFDKPVSLVDLDDWAAEQVLDARQLTGCTHPLEIPGRDSKGSFAVVFDVVNGRPADLPRVYRSSLPEPEEEPWSELAQRWGGD